MSQSKHFFPQTEALRFSELEALREKMDARSEPDIDILMRSIGVPVTKDKFEIDDGIPIVQNRKAVLYIQEPGNPDAYGFPKYHIFHCSKIKEMQEQGLYHRYHASSRTDGKFHLKLSSTNELSLRELVLCKLCLRELKSRFGWNVFPKEPEDFPLADWLEPFYAYSSDEWKNRSQACREKAKWTCQECGINLQSNSHFLHAHHKWGTKFDAPEDLIALCIGCHAEQSVGGHRMLKYGSDYQVFMGEYGEEWRSYRYPF